MTTLLDDRPVTTTGDDDPDIDHIVCCSENAAMCGLDVTEHPWSEDETKPECPLCAYLWDEGLPCPVAGCTGGEVTG